MPTASPTSEPFDALLHVWPGALAHPTGIDAAPPASPTPLIASAEDLALVARLRRGEEDAFVALLDRHHAALLRLARVWVADPAIAEEVVQETWLAVLRGVDGFAGRSSLKTWIVGILANQAKRRAERERRSVPFSALARATSVGDGAPSDPDRFVPASEAGAGRWAAPPEPWTDAPEARLLAAEARTRIVAAIEALPPRHRAVILLRDVQGLDAEEARNVLGVSATNQRVLLHRARRAVRAALASYLEGRTVVPIPPTALTCREFVELVADDLAGHPAPAPSAAAAAHLAGCRECRIYRSQLRRTVRALGSLPPEPIAPESRRALLRLFRRWRRTRPAPPRP